MPDATDLKQLSEQGKKDFEAGQYEAAAAKFRSAADGYGALGDPLNAAELKNNLSVALLKLGQNQAALDIIEGTEQVFSGAGDLRRQAMAIGNRATALEALHRWDDALAAYEQSAAVFAQAGEGELRSIVLKSAAGLKLRRGKVSDSAFKMIGSLEAKPQPSFFERVLKSILRFVQR